MTPYTSPDYRAMIAAIRKSPQDDHLRLVAADWLEEQGESDKSQSIRDAVSSGHSGRWFWQNGLHVAVDRGFIILVKGTLAAIRYFGPAIAAREPVEGCVVVDADLQMLLSDPPRYAVYRYRPLAGQYFRTEAEARAALNDAVWREIVVDV